MGRYFRKAVFLVFLIPVFSYALTVTVNNGIGFGTLAIPNGTSGSTITIDTSGNVSTNNPNIFPIGGSGAQAGSVSLTNGTADTAVTYSFSYNPINSALSLGSATTNPSGSCTLDGSGGGCTVTIGATVTLSSPSAGTYSASNGLVMTLTYT